jgi:hypothetical protein
MAVRRQDQCRPRAQSRGSPVALRDASAGPTCRPARSRRAAGRLPSARLRHPGSRAGRSFRRLPRARPRRSRSRSHRLRAGVGGVGPRRQAHRNVTIPSRIQYTPMKFTSAAGARTEPRRVLPSDRRVAPVRRLMAFPGGLFGVHARRPQGQRGLPAPWPASCQRLRYSGPGLDSAAATRPSGCDGRGHDSGFRDRRGAGRDGPGHNRGPRNRRTDDSDSSDTCSSQGHLQSPTLVVASSASMEAMIA